MTNHLSPLSLPRAKKIEKTIVQHGHKRVDSYAWLRDKNWKDFISGKLNFHDPEILDYIQTENAWTEYKMSGCQKSIRTITEEMLSREREVDVSFPFERGDYLYYRRQHKKDDYPLFCRKKKASSNKEDIYFDVNKEAEGKPLYTLANSSSISDDNCFFAYGYNLTGSMEKNLRFIMGAKRDESDKIRMDYGHQAVVGNALQVHEVGASEMENRERNEKMLYDGSGFYK